jgi:hypothetical protein
LQSLEVSEMLHAQLTEKPAASSTSSSSSSDVSDDIFVGSALPEHIARFTADWSKADVTTVSQSVVSLYYAEILFVSAILITIIIIFVMTSYIPG